MQSHTNSEEVLLTRTHFRMDCSALGYGFTVWMLGLLDECQKSQSHSLKGTARSLKQPPDKGL